MGIPRPLFDSSADHSSRPGRLRGLSANQRVLFVLWVLALWVGTPSVAQDVTDRPNSEAVEATGQAATDQPVPPPSDEGGEGAATDRRRHALIVVGLAGDEAHSQRFQSTVKIWRQWLVQQAGVKEAQIAILSGPDESDGFRAATAEAIGGAVADLANRVREQDSVWVFLIGHGSQDRRDGWFHLPGPDLSAVAWADLFAPLKSGEQVFWLTHSASGSFLKPLSRPGRIVITATDPEGEVNETRFPHALAAVMRQESADSKGENAAAPPSPTLLGLFRAAVENVRDSFEQDMLVPTEHAQLDDNGDGKGTEVDELVDVTVGQAAELVPGGEVESAEDNVKSVDTMDESGAPVDGPRASQTPIEFTSLHCARGCGFQPQLHRKKTLRLADTAPKDRYAANSIRFLHVTG